MTAERNMFVGNNEMIDVNHNRTTYYYEVRCAACRTKLQKGNRLEASVQMINHMLERHEKEDWKNLLDAQIIQMYWNSPQAGHSLMTVKEVMEFLGLLAKDQDIPYEYYVRFANNHERNGV